MKNKLPLLAIVLIGVLTPALSTALFYWWRPAAQVNLGEVLPPRPLAAAHWQRLDASASFSPHEWRGDWTLAFAADGACGAQCRRHLCQMRQLRLMLPGHYLRIRRAWLITDDAAPPATLPQPADCGELNNPHIRPRRHDTLAGVELLRAAAADLPPAAACSPESYLYLIDPAGLWAMRFSPELSTYDIQKDLKRLLRISKGRKLKSGSPLTKLLIKPARHRQTYLSARQAGAARCQATTVAVVTRATRI